MISSSYARLAKRSHELSKSISYSFLIPSFALPPPTAPSPKRTYATSAHSRRANRANADFEDALVVLQSQHVDSTPCTAVATPSRRSPILSPLYQAFSATHDHSSTRIRGVRHASTMAAPAPVPDKTASTSQHKELVGNKGKRKARPKRTRPEDKDKIDTPPPPRPIPIIPSAIIPPSSSTPPLSSPVPPHSDPSLPDSDNLPLSPRVSQFYSVHLLPHPTVSQIKYALRNIPQDAPFELLQKYRKLIIGAGLMKDEEVISDLVCGFVGVGEYSSGLRFMKEAVRVIVKSSTESDPKLSLIFHAPVVALLRKEKFVWVTLFTNVAIVNGTLDTPLLGYRIRSLVQLKRYRDIPYTFDQFQLHRLIPTGNIYDDVVLSLLLNGDLSNAQKVLAEKSDRGFKTTVLTCLALLEGMRQFGGNKAMETKILSDRAMAISEVEGLSTPERIEQQRSQLKGNVVVLNRIMSIRVERGDLDGALKVLDYFNTQNLPFDLALPLVIPPPRRLPSSDPPIIKPSLDLASFTILIGLSSKFRRLDCALDLFQQSQELRLGTNDYLLAAVIKSLVIAGEVELAKKFFLDLADGTARLPNRPLDKIKPFKPTNRLFEALWWGILRSEGLEGANLILSKFAYYDALPSTRLSLFSNITVTDHLVSDLVQYLTKVRNRSSAASTTKMCAELIVRVSKFTKGDRKPSIGDLNALLDVAWQKERFRNSSNERYFARRMEKRPIVLPSSTTAPASSLPLSADSPPPLAPSPSPTPTAVFRIKASLDSRGVKGNIETTELVLRNDRAFQSIESRWEYLQREVIDRGMRPTHLHFAYIIRAYIELGDIFGAKEVLVRAKEAGCDPHVSWYSILIGGCHRLGKPQLARETLDEMRYIGVRPDRLLYNTLALGFARRGNLDGVIAVQRQAQQYLNDSPLSESTNLDLDLVYITLRYRALVVASKLFQAQLYIKKVLSTGLVPDLALLKVLQTTGRYLRNKVNAASRRGGGSGGRLFESPASRIYGAEKIIHYHANNLRDARRLYSKSLKGKGNEELRKFDEFGSGRRKLVASRVEVPLVAEGEQEGVVYPLKKMTTVKVRGTSSRKRVRRGRTSL